MRASRAHAKAWRFFAVFVLLAFASLLAGAATPPNTTILNTATVSYDVGGAQVTSTGTASVTTAASTPATIQFMAYVPPGITQGTGGAYPHDLTPTVCQAGSGAAVTLSAPSVPGQATLQLPGPAMLAPAAAYAARDVAFVQVTDFSANTDPLVRQSITVLVTAPSGDAETLRLQETGASTGVFIGYLPLVSGTAQPGSCTLQAKSNERVMATYVQAGTSAVATSVALVDPLGLVFDSATGRPVDGARVTLIDVATGGPAQVRGDDAVSTYPSTVVTGTSVSDSSGKVYAPGPGRYQFPRVAAPGSYRLVVEPPLGYRFPSQVPDATLQQLATAPFTLTTVSRGGQFTILPGPAIETDVPLDPGPLGTVDLTKVADKSVAALGDFVPYQVSLATASEQPLPGAELQDRLPPGFRFVAGSARLNGAPLTDPVRGADGRTLLFALGTLPAKSSAVLRYVALVGPSAVVGPAQNVARMVGKIVSNTASASITVHDELNRSRAILAGQVTIAPSCDADQNDRATRRPVRNARVLLQDGTYVITDEEGNWHIDNLRPGTHVVQLDATTLPQGLRLRSCEQNSRTGGRDLSQFVNVRGGTLWRADFRLVPESSCLRQDLRWQGQEIQLSLGGEVAQPSVTATIVLPQGAKADAAGVLLDGRPAEGVQVEDGFVVLRLPPQPAHWERHLAIRLLDAGRGGPSVAVRLQQPGGAVALPPLAVTSAAPQASACAALPAPDLSLLSAGASPQSRPVGAAQETTIDTTTVVEQLRFDDKWLAAAAPGAEWLHPKEGFVPALPAVKVAVKHATQDVVELRVNGAAVDPLRFDGTVLGPSGALAVSVWRAVDLKEGGNLLELLVRDPQGAVVLRESRVIHYGVTPARAEFDASHSRLVADGRTVPLVAVRFLDASGKPVRRGALGEFLVDPPYVPQPIDVAMQRDPLSGAAGGKAKFEVGADGVALIPLRPTTQSGEAVLHFDFNGKRTAEVRAWLQADQREWVLVGFAEGTVGHKQLAGNLEALRDAGGAEQLFDQDRLAFYAKGMVKGEYLLTAAYDSAKEKGTGVNPALRQAIDPNSYYTLYGDSAQQQYDAASVRKLYVKIEKKQFYALFGDFDTGLTVTELGRYSRTVNGVKSEFRGERFRYNAFATRTGQAFLRDEIQGDGTSGLYRLRASNVVAGTEKVRVEVRDRFKADRVLASRPLTPWIDYQVDYALGTFFLREPLASRDPDLNPQMLVIEYETDGGAGEAWTYGGRAAAQVSPSTVVGVTRIHEGDLGRQGTLTAADAAVRVGEATKARIEVASSSAQVDTGLRQGTAYVAELQHDDERIGWVAYARSQQPGFGLGQQSVAAQGVRRVGAEGRAQLSETVQSQGEVSRQQDLSTGASRDLVEARVQWAAAEHVKLQAGARSVAESDGRGAEASTRQATLGAAYDAMDQRLVLRASTDLDIGSHNTTVSSPDRIVLAADYKLTPGTVAYVQHEIARGETVRIGTTSVGLRTTPWEGAELKSSVGSQASTDAGRLFASLGLVQRLRISEKWSADAGVEQTRTLSGARATDPLGVARPPVSGTVPVTSPVASVPSGSTPASGYGLVAGDFTAVTAGLAFRETAWSANGRVEWRGSDTETKVNVLLGLQRRLAEGEAVAAGVQWTDQHGAGEGSLDKVAARISYAHRPNHADWMWLDRLEYVQESSEAGTFAARLFTRKLINNFNANWKPQARTQVALQYGAKYVREMLQDFGAKGYTDLLGAEARYDLTPKLDVGLHAGMLHAWSAGVRTYQLGLSVGYRVAANTWVSVGYNAAGFRDADFSGAEYRAKGVYLNIRAKFDQDTFDLNDRANNAVSLQ